MECINKEREKRKRSWLVFYACSHFLVLWFSRKRHSFFCVEVVSFFGYHNDYVFLRILEKRVMNELIIKWANYQNIWNICTIFYRSVKLSSPVLNNVIIMGSFMMYVAVVVATIDYSHVMDNDRTSSNLCMVCIDNVTSFMDSTLRNLLIPIQGHKIWLIGFNNGF